MHLTSRLKSELWARYGAPDHPAEWDGHVYGGGRLSQRFWEYFKAIELLDMTPDAVVLDIGGGSPTTGAGFFASLLASAVRRVFVLDPSIPDGLADGANTTLIRKPASYEVLRELLSAHPEITHVASISVFEHIEPAIREGMIRAINEAFKGGIFVATFEYHARRTYFEHQLTARSVSALFSPFTNFFPDEFVSSPIWCENAFDPKRIARVGARSPIAPGHFAPANIPLWYPVAVRFVRHIAPNMQPSGRAE